MGTLSRFTAADYVIFFLTIAISMSIGIFFAAWERRKKHNTPEHYFLAGRKLKSLPLALSFIVTFQSSILFLGFPAEGYLFGSTLAFHTIAYALGTIFSSLVVIPLFHPLKLISVYQYLYLRYGDRYLQMYTLVTGMIYSLLYMGTVTYGTCVALELVMGLPVWATILIYTIVTFLYTAIGGIKAVIWSDVFQFVVMFTGIVAVVVKGTNDTGGVTSVFENGKDRFSYIEVGADPRLRYTVWNLSIGCVSIFINFSFMQPAMQRIYSTPSVRTARHLYWISIPGFSIMMILATISGTVIFAYYSSKGCDIYEAGIVKNMNAIMPFAVLDLFQEQPGLAGLFIAALSSAALSTLSSSLNSLSAVSYIDIISIKYPNMSADTSTKVSKVFVIFYGVLAMGTAFLCTAIPGSVMAVFTALGACVGGPTCGIFLLSMMFRRATTKGVFTGAILGSAIPIWIYFGRMFSDVPSDPFLPGGPTDQCQNLTESLGITYTSDYAVFNTSTQTTLVTSQPTGSIDNDQPAIHEFYKVSFMLWSMTGCCITIIVGTLASLLTKPPESFDERCLFSFRKHVLEELFGQRKESTNGVSSEHLRLTGL